MTRPEIPVEAEAFLKEWLGNDWLAEPLAGDVSVRQYYRVFNGGERYMLAYYPESVRGGVGRFVSAYEAIEHAATVPPVLRHSDAVVAQMDVGDETLFDRLRENRPEGLSLYRRAVDLLVTFQSAQSGAESLNQAFTASSFRQELEMTREFYLQQLLGSGDAGSTELAALMDILCEKITSHPYTLCHRDYHGQNIHIFRDELYIIDYQDMRMGPDTYDLASLLRDRGIAELLGRDVEDELVDHYAARIGGGSATSEIRQRYFETLLQRSIKILGTFAKASIVRNKGHYLDFIPPTLESISRCLEQLPELEAFGQFFPIPSGVGVHEP